MNFLNSNFSGSHISTLGGKSGERSNYKTGNNSIFIETTPPNPRLKIKFGYNLHWDKRKTLKNEAIFNKSEDGNCGMKMNEVSTVLLLK